ncbi:28S ribosomal protein S31, mitochondrial [Malaclemys terrapin pileata]|uniref:28S ribosomal protein S31, mitochondrial n=1 Tax=Malaclemys terrapin pileata TaxID=2991368 RepID=UPI0023A8BEDE|nr:28S ribosomal protein S31, mitochondrial [Malaclemys terrapin pileata]
MWSRVSAVGSRPRPRLLSYPWGAQDPAAGAPRQEQGPGSKTQKCVSTSTGFYNKEDESATSTDSSAEKASENQEKATPGNTKKNLLNIIGEMKVELSSKKKFQFLKKMKTTKQTKDQPESLESASSMFQKATADSKAKRSKPLNPELVEAASAVASSLPFDRKQTVSDLLAQLKKHEEATDAQKRGETTNISNIIADMKIGKRHLNRGVSRPSSQISFDDDDGQGDMSQRGILSEFPGSKRGALHLGRRLNIFPVSPTVTEGKPEAESSPTLWDLEFANQLAAINQKPPRNGFEEMIQWTKEGKLWEFPINNEAGIEDDVEFHEHIFLDKYLEDFTKQGPIRHFMELVTCGLSKNPYLSVKQKVEHIEWFQNYFQEKEELLKEIDDHKKETDLSLERKSLSE